MTVVTPDARFRARRSGEWEVDLARSSSMDSAAPRVVPQKTVAAHRRLRGLRCCRGEGEEGVVRRIAGVMEFSGS